MNMELKQKYIAVDTFDFDTSFIDKLSDTFSTIDVIKVTKKIDRLAGKDLMANQPYTFGGLLRSRNKKDRFFSVDIMTYEGGEISLVDVNEIELNEYLELINHGQYFEHIKYDS